MLVYVIDGEINFSRGLTENEKDGLECFFDDASYLHRKWSKSGDCFRIHGGDCNDYALTDIFYKVNEMVKNSDLHAEGSVTYEADGETNKIALVDNGEQTETYDSNELIISAAPTDALLLELKKRFKGNEEADTLLEHLLSLAS